MDENLFINNDTDIVSTYVVGLKSLNSGENKSSVDISWTKLDDAIYSLVFDNSEIVVDTNITTLEMNPGEFKKVVLKVESDILYTDSIIVFTKLVESVSNFLVSPFSSPTRYELSWQNSAEFENNIIFRANVEEGEFPYFSFDDYGAISSYWDTIRIVENNTEQTYIDTVNLSTFDYYYVIKTIDENNNFRFSSIPNINTPIQNSSLEFINVSDNLFNRIELEWNTYSEDDFYEMELWRSSDFDSPVDVGTLLGEFSDPTIEFYFDIDNLVGGIVYNYQFKITNIYGQIYLSEVTSGRVHP